MCACVSVRVTECRESFSINILFSQPAVEATLRGDETPPTRLDSISVKEIPPPVPNTPRPRPPPPQTPPLTHEERPSSKQSHSHFHRALPAPPTVSRTKELGGQKSVDNSPPLPPNRPSSPHTVNNTHSHNSSSRPPPPRRPQIPPPNIPRSNQASPPPTPSERPAPPRKPKPPLPRRPSNLSTSTSPPPPPPNKPILNRRQDSGSQLSSSYNIDLTPSDSLQDMIARLQQSAPDILTAMQDRYGRVPQFLEDLANLTENIVDAAQASPCTKTISFRTLITSLRGEYAILRDSKGPLWQKNEEKVTKCVNDIVRKVTQLSSHLG